MKKGESKKIRKNFRRFWNLLWKDDSLKGWIFSVIFIMVFILLIFFPLLRLITNTSLPLAIVESCSMYHQGNVFSNFDNWWDRQNSKYVPFIINKLDFQDFPLKNGFSKGDILFIVGVKPEKVKEGDIIIFSTSQYPNPLIHRVIDIKEEEGKFFFSTIGDNNENQLSVEKEISGESLVGKAVLRVIPYVGWFKLVFFEGFRPVSERGFCKEN